MIVAGWCAASVKPPSVMNDHEEMFDVNIIVKSQIVVSGAGSLLLI